MIKIGRNQGKDVFYDPSRAQNGHMLLLGKSGTGKTTESEKIMLSLVQEGATVIAFDVHQTLALDQIFKDLEVEFSENCEIHDVYADGICCPFFTPLQLPSGNTEKKIATVEAMTAVMERVFRLGIDQKASLRRALSDIMETGAYQKDGLLAVDKVLHRMGGKVETHVREKLHMLTHGEIFIDGDFFVAKGKINIIRLSDFPEDTQVEVAEMILAFIWRLALARALPCSPIYVFIDEVQNLSLTKNSIVAKLLSEGRKFGVNLIFATQSLRGGFSRAEAERIQQADLEFFFKPADDEMAKIASMIDRAEAKTWMLELSRLERAECIVKGSLSIGGVAIREPLKLDCQIGERL